MQSENISDTIDDVLDDDDIQNETDNLTNQVGKNIHCFKLNINNNTLKLD